MKKIKIYTYLLIISFSTTFSSCSDDYLDTSPSDSIGDKEAYSTSDNLMAIINGMHRNMYTRQNSNQGEIGYTSQLIYTDVLGEDLILPSVGNSYFVSMLRWNDPRNDSSAKISYFWNFWYQMIRNANNIITYGNDATGDIKLKEKALGEAHAYGAFSYFQLVQIYADRYQSGKFNDQLGVVIKLDPAQKLVSVPKARSNVEEVYAQIWEDLNKAEALLKDKSKTNNSHFGYDNVMGIKARVALIQQDYAKADQYATLARAGKQLMTQEDYKQGFNNFNNVEWMWGISVQEDQSDGSGNFYAFMSRNYNSTNIRQSPKVVSKKLFKSFSSTDVRTQVIDPTGIHKELNLPKNFAKYPYTSQKFITRGFNYTSPLGDVPFMRVAEMYLIEAEAKYFLGDEVGSKAALAELVKARDTAFTDFSTNGQEYLNEIYLNRRIELWGEGFRFFDLKRTNSTFDRNDTGAVTAIINSVWTINVNDSRWTWLIPRSEIDANPLCEQNKTQ